MPSFDIVSEVDEQEVANALNQARKEITNRFDLKGAGAEIDYERPALRLRANDAFKLSVIREILLGKLARRNVSLKNIEIKPPSVSSTGKASQELVVKQGLDSDAARVLTHAVRETGLKVQAQIQGEQVRVTGKNRDDLQQVITALRGRDFPHALSFQNFRD
ncbi:MAG: YajQ family cyclic di-GMP-binding protein [Methylacidiphilaceae bacterium]|nr:YajQ family cyclic di-GMP-binding protein [Candidatus Methylacidiphilaceae bacterium]